MEVRFANQRGRLAAGQVTGISRDANHAAGWLCIKLQCHIAKSCGTHFMAKCHLHITQLSFSDLLSDHSLLLAKVTVALANPGTLILASFQH